MNTSPDRRQFLGATAAGLAALAVAPGIAPRRRRGAAAVADSRIEVLLGEPVGTIAPEVYGHFVEHLGGVVYDGIWVGENSRVPNVGGIRRDLAEAFRRIKPSVVRWPGGCFADSYDWRDGVGPRAQRPRRTSLWADDPQLKVLGNVPQHYEPNAFGTSEFMRFCRLAGARPYLAANVRTLPAQAFMQWLDYCNAPAGTTTLADLRAAGGDKDPFGVRFWGIGNESWGCGGNFRPEEYAEEYRRFTTWAVPQLGVDLAFIGSGPNGGDVDWTRRCFAALAERGALDRMWGWALHHYSGFEGTGADALAFDDRGWYDLLASATRMESLIAAHWQVMRESDREHRVKLVVDEWGAWHTTHPLVDPAHLFESQSTMRDALVAGLTLDTFNRHADKVAMANDAQLVNCIQALFFTDGARTITTPTYHVFDLYAAHQGARSVRAEFSAPTVSWPDAQGHARTLWGLNGSASVQGATLTLTVTNPHLTEAREAEIAVRGGAVASARSTTLSSHDVHDANTFERPDAVVPQPAQAVAVTAGQPIAFTFPPASVTKLQITLGS
ncbi:MAG TPA: alpha-L-arabinofuranosidase C-terminal domain-containing protein [Opitutaceae bacterium]|nr:alpha-L-arabinofuranosidase C-terminal domain-containing protein [Opitutaceae bacterium]